MFRRPFFWIIAVFLSLVCAFTTAKFFRTAIPQVSVEITMDREEAMEQANILADRFNWGPENYRMAASYRQDSRVKNFVELEAGGIQGFQQFLNDGNYKPYFWRVRLFQEQEARETNIRFTPDGRPYGFTDTLPENEPGAVLPADSARHFAEHMAVTYWGIDFSVYELAESSESMQPGGRLDHVFVYERTDVRIADAPIRLSLHVGGDAFTGLLHQVRVPEHFERSYEEMRSFNSTLSDIATLISFLLFIVIGCGLGLFYLVKNRFLIWKTPVFWGVFVSFMLMLTHFNAWPLHWMEFDTALSVQGHIIEQITIGVVSFIGFAIFFSLLFMVAESLSRKAFPDHIQFWKLWSPGAANSKQVLGITFAALLLVSYELLYVTGVYYAGSNFLGWWYPSSELFQPDILAVYFPWLDAFSISLQAAFWEESLFRAIPIAGAVILGRKYGNMKWWIVGAFILQAFLFGAGHANYPQQPFYARTIELILPSVIFGLLYYFLGLYAAILLHFWYNFTLYSIPVFSSSIPGLLPDKLILIAIGLFPFWVILFQYIRHRRMDECPPEAYNRSWEPDEKTTASEKKEADDSIATLPSILDQRRSLAVIGVLGVLGFSLWLAFSDFKKDIPAFTTTKAEATETALDFWTQKDIPTSDPRNTYTSLWPTPSLQHHYIMEEAGREEYLQLLGTYLSKPQWTARNITFEGTVDERTEEYRAFVSTANTINAFINTIPENLPGAHLDEQEARMIADLQVMGKFHKNPEDLKFLSAVSSQLPDRIDWRIIYADTAASVLGLDETRIQIRLAGSDVSAAYSYVHVSEDWSRERRDKSLIPNTFRLFSIIIMVLIFIAAIVAAIMRWAKGTFSLSWMLVFFSIPFLVMALRYILTWQNEVAFFSTAQPFLNQVLTNTGFSLVSWLVVGLTYGLTASFIQSWKQPVSSSLAEKPLCAILSGVFPVLSFAGLFALLQSLTTSTDVNWGLLKAASSTIPVIYGMTSPIIGFLLLTTLLILIFGSIHTLSSGWQKRRLISGVLFMLSGLFLVGIVTYDVSSWFITGLLTGAALCIIYVVILRHHLPLVVLMSGTWVILNFTEKILEPVFPGAVAAYILGVLLIAAGAWIWYSKWTAVRIQNTL
ncbi:hypothetical protein QLX67_07730 [Balneolaceae bacterium ANBcel3]|nr:hypothetical protein [Balneolaceae bacterium ANBcel3]